MSQKPLHKFFILDGQPVLTSDFDSGKYDGGVYEVLRVVNGVALFSEEHLDRFFNSMKIEEKKTIFTKQQIENQINILIQNNEVEIGNILMSFNMNLATWFIPHSYPAENLYDTGVECGLLKAERKNPNAKVLHTQVRKDALQMLSENNFYEVLLVDSHSRITEGSKSNVFFIKEDEIFTAPAKDVLLGITRQKTISLASELNIRCTEKEIYTEDIASFQAAFVTGTSPKILPIKKIGDSFFDPKNPLLIRLIDNYNHLIDNYITLKLIIPG